MTPDPAGSPPGARPPAAPLPPAGPASAVAGEPAGAGQVEGPHPPAGPSAPAVRGPAGPRTAPGPRGADTPGRAGRGLRGAASFGAGAALLAAVCLAALCLGEPVLSPAGLVSAIGRPDSLEALVVGEVRLPRMLLGLAAGVALGCAGLLLQEALRNPLAVPELLGVSAGAAGVTAAITVFGLPVAAGLVPAFALAGAVGGGALCLAVARRAGDAASVLLTGAAVSTALTGGVYAITSMADRFELGLVFRYLMGSLVGAGWEELAMVAPWLLGAAPLLVLCLPLLGVLGLGDDAASALGLDPARARLAVLATAAVLVAVTVAACGPVSWVGFLAPMLARRLHPHAEPRTRLLWSGLLGGLVTVGADLAARTALHPIELPLGAFTGSVGIVGGLLLLRAAGAKAVPR